ncbi:MAG: rhomboid family intramembrane serine protease [Planctomycetia bacterium]
MFVLLPIGDEPNQHLRKPVLTWLLVAANVAIFAVMASEGGREESLEPVLRRWGYVPAVADPVTVLTHMFCHVSWLHVLGNCLFLWIFGDNVESRLGHLRFLVAYLATGVAALYVHLLFEGSASDQVLVGASGAVSGVQGLYFVACPGARVRMLFWFIYIVRTFLVPARLVMVLWFLVQDVVPVLVAGRGDNVAHWAHLGGFASGLLLMGLLLPWVGRNERPQRPSVNERYRRRLPPRGL